MDEFIRINSNESADKMNLYNSLNAVKVSFRKPKFPYNLLKTENNLDYKNIYEKYIHNKQYNEKTGGTYVFTFNR